jgi:hypothetical protein
MAVEFKKLAYEDDVITKALLTAKGDIIYASAAGTPAALAIGTDDYILRVATDLPAWEPLGAPAAHTLNSHTVPDGAVDFNLQQATDLVFMTVAAEANLPAGDVALGQPVWCTSEKTLHLCTSAS